MAARSGPPYGALVRRPLTLLLAVLTTLTAVLALAGPASAHPRSKSVTDRVGEVPAGVDLVSGTFSISKRKAVWSVRVKKLTDTTFVAFESLPLNDSWDRVTVFRERGRTVGRVYFIDNEEETTPYAVRCGGLRVTWKPSTGKVRAVVPRSCMQSSQPGYGPYQFWAYTRFGGSPGSAGDSLRAMLDL